MKTETKPVSGEKETPNMPNRFLKQLAAIPVVYWITGLVLLVVYIANFRFDMIMDAGKFAAVSKHIHESGDYIRLKIFGEPYDQKPPFLFWLASFSFHLFGESNFSFKLPTFLFTLFGTFATYKLGESIYSKRVGIIASIVLITSQGLLLYNNDTHTDVVLTACVVAAIWQLHSFIVTGKWHNYLIGFIFAGLAMLTKGPIGLAVPVFAVVSHILVTRNFRLLWPHKWIPGLIIAFAVVSPALIGLYQQFGLEGIKFYFWTNNVGRITGTYTKNSNDYFYYLHTLAWVILPFTILTFWAFYQEIRSWVKKRCSFGNVAEGVTLAIPLFLVILSVAKMKSPHYMLPVIPLIAIITAKWTDKLVFGGSFGAKAVSAVLRVQNILLIILVVAVLIMPVYFFPSGNILLWLVVLSMIGYFFYLVAGKSSPVNKAILVPVLAVLIVNVVLTFNFLPNLFQYVASANASRDFNKASSSRGELFVMNSLDYEIGFYAKNHPKFLEEGNLPKLAEVEEPWMFTDSIGRERVMAKFPEAKTFKRYKYKRVTRINLKFLLPGRRAADLGNMYLLKIKD